VDSNSKFWQRGQSAGLEKIMTLKNKKKSHFLFKSHFFYFYVQAGNTRGRPRVDNAINNKD